MTVKDDNRWPVIEPLDRRLKAWRTDLADARLKGSVEAAQYVEGRPARICVPVADLRAEPDPASSIDHQLLFGEQVLVFDTRDGWAWVQSCHSNYVGWTDAESVGDPGSTATHRITAPRSFVYPGPDMKLPPDNCLSMGSLVVISCETTIRGTDYLLLEDGTAIIARHAAPVNVHEADYVAVASKFLGAPYLWGGASAFGMDCSGLVYLAMAMCGHVVPRDSDMQAAGLGTPFDPGGDHASLRRGDLVFWRGHVAIVEGNGNLLHANGHTMDVISEPFEQAVERIAAMFEKPIGFRRHDTL